MTTYNTYAEAKIANPLKETYELDGLFGTKEELIDCGVVGFIYESRPADHCTSLEAFFDAGHKFEDGDIYLNKNGIVKIVGKDIGDVYANIRTEFDSVCFVLSAKALEGNLELSAEDVPEGATHYCDGTFVMMNDSSNDYGWCKVWFEGKWHKNAPIANCIRIEELVKKDSAKETEQIEWKNGDIVYAKRCSYDEITFIGIGKNKAMAICECITEDGAVFFDKFWVSDLIKEKPETPEQKKECELNAIFKAAINDIAKIKNVKDCNVNIDASFEIMTTVKAMIEVGYRKPE